MTPNFELTAVRKKIRSNILFGFGILAGLIAVLTGCTKDPDNIGKDLLPSSDSIIVKIDSSTLISSYTITGKRVLSSSNELYVLGSQKDSIFGYSKASILTEYHPALLISADSVRRVDSLVLYLSAPTHYGDTLGSLTLRMYELSQQLNYDSSYYSDMDPSEYFDPSKEIASTSFTAKDSLIRVKITNPEFISKFENLPDSVFKDYVDFANTFYGMYLTVDQASGQGFYSYLNMSSSYTRMIMYYNGDTVSSVYEMGFTSIAAKANAFSHDYTGFKVAENLNTPDSKDTLIYIDGLAGVSGRISFPEFEDWKLKGMITINKAELILPVDTLLYPGLSSDKFPPKLLLFYLVNDTTYDYLYDYRIDQGGTYFDGVYDSDLKAYKFNIALHMQSFLSGKIENKDLIIVSRKSNNSANRVVLKGGNFAGSPVKLKVIYTELY